MSSVVQKVLEEQLGSTEEMGHPCFASVLNQLCDAETPCSPHLLQEARRGPLVSYDLHLLESLRLLSQHLCLSPKFPAGPRGWALGPPWRHMARDTATLGSKLWVRVPAPLRIVRAWVSHVVLLSLSFPVCRMRMLMEPASSASSWVEQGIQHTLPTSEEPRRP